MLPDVKQVLEKEEIDFLEQFYAYYQLKIESNSQEQSKTFPRLSYKSCVIQYIYSLRI